MTKDELAAIVDTQVLPVEVPQWGGRLVHVRQMTAGEAIEWEAVRETIKDDRQAVMVELLSRTLCLATGERMFADASEAALLLTKSVAAVTHLFNEAVRVNFPDVEELQKN